MQSLQELMESLKPYILQYAEEFNIVPNNSGFIHCLNPEHDDHNPSMHFWEENNIFHCFSCSINYDIFSLASLLEGKPECGPEFIEENVFYLARKYGLPYEHLQKTLTAEEVKKQTLFRVMKVFSEYVTKNVNKDYIRKRNISEDTAKILNIGSVPSFKDCITFLKNKFNFKSIDEYLTEIGITNFKINENKLIFIIKDQYGRPSSFVSREMNETPNAPKYINGNETEIFKKSSIFYGWSDIKKKFNFLDSLLIVEGYIDFVSAFQKGFRNVVALGSASFTDEHLEFLERNRLINKIAISLDNDETGKKRTNSLVERFKNKQLKKEYVIAKNKLTQYKDLDEVIQNSNSNIKLKDIYELMSLFEFELEELKKGDFDESLIFDKFVTIISQTKTPKNRAEQARVLSKYLNNYTYKTILEQIDYILESKNENYKEDVKKIFNYAVRSLDKNPENAIDILDSIKEEISDVNRQYNKKKIDLFERGLEAFDDMEQEKTNSDLFTIEFRIPWFDDMDLTPGRSVIISSLPNSGKTTLLQQLTVNICMQENNGFVLYVSTDDSAEKIYSNIIANITGLPRDYCSNPFFHSRLGRDKGNINNINIFERYMQGKEIVRRLIENKKLLIIDVKHGSDNWIKFESTIKDIGNREQMKDKFKILIVDSANKISVDSTLKDEIGFISENIKKLSEKYKFLSFLNFEINKTQNNQRLSQYNLSGSRRMIYDCDALGFIYNPERNLQNIYDTKMVWNNNGRNSPVIVSLQEKTKIGNNQNNAIPYFYKLEEISSKLIPVYQNSPEYNYFNSVWQNEFNNQYIK